MNTSEYISIPGSLAIQTRSLTKRFGRHTAVSDLELNIPTGSVYALLGPNGSGKSTTMKLLLGLTSATSGEIFILGTKLDAKSRKNILAQTGALIETPPGYPHLTGRENLRIVQAMTKVSNDQIEHAVELVRLTAHVDKRVKDYSLGMKQRLGIAIALIRNPRLLILDEPTNGLDPVGISEMRTLITELAEGGTTVMVSSHLLGEIDRIATHVGIISDGRIVYQGSRDGLLAAASTELIAAIPQPTLEDIFLDLTKEGVLQ